MEQLKAMKSSLIAAAQGQMGNLQQTDTHELGEVMDMIKDLSEAIYYCTITEAMDNQKESDGQTTVYYTERQVPMASQSTTNGNTTRHNYYEQEYPKIYTHDYREGRSPIMRRMYMESKQTNNTEQNIRELETYMQELGSDLTEMVKDATPQEKELLQKKLTLLAEKVRNA